MELIFKKYHQSELHTETNYLIYDPARNPAQFTKELFQSIAHRNFVQGCENILIGPIMGEQGMTLRVFSADGTEVSASPLARRIFEAYLHDQGYPLPASFKGARENAAEHTDIRAFGTVYHFTA